MKNRWVSVRSYVQWQLKKKNMTQEMLAANAGWAFSTNISGYLSGKKRFGLVCAQRMLDGLGEPNHILRRSERREDFAGRSFREIQMLVSKDEFPLQIVVEKEPTMLFNVLVLVQPEAGQLPLEQGIVVEASNTEHARTEALRTAGFFNLNPLRVVGVMYSKEQKQ